MNKQNGLFWRAVVFLAMTAFVLAGCENPSSESDIAVTFNSVTADGSATQTTTQVTLVFDSAIEGLIADDITLIGVDGVTKGTLTGSGVSYTLGIGGFTTGGTLTAVVEKAGFVISGAAKSTIIYYFSSGTAVTFSSVTANGSATQTSTQLTLVFDNAIEGLTANDITLTGVDGVTKGTLSGSGPSYTLGISGFTAGGTVNVTVMKTGYTISDLPKSTAIYYYSDSSSDIAVTFNSVTANGSTTETTTQLTLIFDNTIEGLAADDIILTGVDGIIKGSLSGSGPSYTFGISGFTAGGTVNVTVMKTGYTINDSPKSTAIYYYSDSSSDIAVTFSSVTANGSTTETTTQLTLIFDNTIEGLTTDDIILTGVDGIIKGNLSGSGPSYTLEISGFTTGETLNVTVAKTGYTINGSPQTTVIYYYSDTAVTFSSVTANGSATQSTTELTLTFSQAINGLTADDITLTGVDGIIKGSLSDSGPSYTLEISGFTTSGTLDVAVAKTGYTISGSPQTTAIYYYTVPSAPMGVSATAQSSNSIEVTWNEVSGASSYKVYYAISSYGTYTFVGTSYTTSYTSTGWAAATTVYFKITAVNSTGESDYSSYGYATTQASKPNVPTGVTATAQSSSSIKVTWNAVSEATSYKVYYTVGSSSTKNVASGNITGTSYTHTGLTANTTYWYYIIAVNSAGESNYSLSDYATTQSSNSGGNTSSKLAAPTGVSAYSGGTFVQISFNVVPLAYTYELYRSTSATGTYTKITATGGSSGSQYILTDSSPRTGTSYYKVKALPNTTYYPNLTASDLSSYDSVTR